MSDLTETIEPLERETVNRVAWRLLPLLMLGYFCAYLDRVNVGFAGLTMNKSLGFSSAVFGFGAGVFFIGYFLLEVPSNLIMARVGARVWIARILITWGIISGLTAFVWNDWSFYGIRFLLVSGQPLQEPVAWYGPIVMNTQAELRDAFDELERGTFLKQR